MSLKYNLISPAYRQMYVPNSHLSERDWNLWRDISFPGDKTISILGIFTSNTEKPSVPDRVATVTKCHKCLRPAFLLERLALGFLLGEKKRKKTDVVSYVWDGASEERVRGGAQLTAGETGKVSLLLSSLLLGQKCHRLLSPGPTARKRRRGPGRPLSEPSPGRGVAVAGCFFFFF